jgi:hypothetical protein
MKKNNEIRFDYNGGTEFPYIMSKEEDGTFSCYYQPEGYQRDLQFYGVGSKRAFWKAFWKMLKNEASFLNRRYGTELPSWMKK